DDLVLALGQDLPAKRLCPEPGQAGQVVSVNDDVVESDRHVDSMRGTMNRDSRTRALLTANIDPHWGFGFVLEHGEVDCAGAGVTRSARRAEGDLLAALGAGRGAGIAHVRRPGLDSRLAGRAGHPDWLWGGVLGP